MNRDPIAPGILLPGERLDDLQRDNLRIIQRADGFRFGMDAVLLAAFAAERAGREAAIDLGTGSGILPLLICARVKNITFDAVEILPDVADMAARSVRLSGMGSRIAVHALDLRKAPQTLGYERYRLAVCNPPYTPAGAGPTNPDAMRRTARHAGETTLEAICLAAGALLQNGGRFTLVYPAPRLLAAMDAMRAGRIEPKRIRLVHPAWGKAPNLALLEGVKAAKPMLHFLPPLFIRDESGRETEELRHIYEA